MHSESSRHCVTFHLPYHSTRQKSFTCRVLTTSCILARPRSRKLSIRSPSIKPVACSVFRSVWKDLQVQLVKEETESAAGYTTRDAQEF